MLAEITVTAIAIYYFCVYILVNEDLKVIIKLLKFDFDSLLTQSNLL